jgi:hypothetical protein
MAVCSRRLPVRVLAVADAVDGDGVRRFLKEHAVIAHSKPEQVVELSA